MLSLHTPQPVLAASVHRPHAKPLLHPPPCTTPFHFPSHATSVSSRLYALHTLTRSHPSLVPKIPTSKTPLLLLLLQTSRGIRTPHLLPGAAAAAAAPEPNWSSAAETQKDGDDSAPHEPNEDDGRNRGEEETDSDRTGPTQTLAATPPKPQLPQAESNDKPKTINTTVQLGVVFGLWYIQNVVFNIYNKKVLNLFPYPWLLASFQLLVGSLWMAALWLSGLQPFPRVSKKFLLALLGPALFHTIGHISACVSFSKVAVSFTHVIKASEPVFSVVFSALHGQFYPLHVWLSVLPIVGGCALAAVTEVSFNAAGLWGALISNVGFVLRNIYSKQSLYDFKHINGLNLYGWISIVSFFYLFPVAVFVEGSQWVGGFQRAIRALPAPWRFYYWVLLSGVFYHLYNQTSYQALDKISPLTFSVGNTMKRVVVIVATVLVFRNPIRPLNALGSAIAVFGTFLYSQATTMGKGANKDTEIAGKKS